MNKQNKPIVKDALLKDLVRYSIEEVNKDGETNFDNR